MRLSRIAAGIACVLAAACGQTPAEQQGNDAEELVNARIHPTVEMAQGARSGAATGIVSDARPSSGVKNLTYQGGSVETAAKVYIVYWGSQWNNNDPSGEAALQQSFFNHVGGSSWDNINTQYCQGVATGTVAPCTGTGSFTNATGQLAGTWYDNASAAPSRPTQTQLANEAVRAAAHFGNTTSASNLNVQYVISTATGNNASGFGTRYCAWHSSTSSSSGNIAYTNFPYITDAGASCGANFNGLGPTAGITIVGGHEYAESITDPFPSSGWVDSGGSEIGDKCAWIQTGSQGASADVTMNNATFAVQSLWSDGSAGGECVLSY